MAGGVQEVERERAEELMERERKLLQALLKQLQMNEADRFQVEEYSSEVQPIQQGDNVFGSCLISVPNNKASRHLASACSNLMLLITWLVTHCLPYCVSTDGSGVRFPRAPLC